MPRLEPFAGLRYAPALPIDKLIAPPYDVVGPAERAALAERHRANAILVELPEEDRGAGLDRYRNAARLFERWQADDLLRRDPGPSLYGYRMRDRAGRVTTGVVGALGCEPDDGDVLPHEQTMAKDMTDRLELLRATGANLSPIWGLSLAEGLTELLTASVPVDGVVAATDDDGVRHELWVIDDADTIAAVGTVVGGAPVVLADGHHRYQTARTYQAERRRARDDLPGGYDAVMAFVVELRDDQVNVGPIHRALSGVSAEDAIEAFERWFDTVYAGPLDDTVLTAISDSAALALVTADGLRLLTPQPRTYEEAESELDSSLVALALADLPAAVVTHHHSWRSAVRAVAGGDAAAAALLRPVTVAQITEWAHARRRMPPKSTFFHPKPRTGMVYRTVETVETPATPAAGTAGP